MDWEGRARQRAQHIQRPCGGKALRGLVIKGKSVIIWAQEGSTNSHRALYTILPSTGLGVFSQGPREAIEEAWAMEVAIMDFIFKAVIGG